MRKWNFSPGPATIPEDVLSEVQSELLEFNNSSISIMEMSHRTELYSSIAFETKKDLIEIDLSLSTSIVFLYFFIFLEIITEKLLFNIKINRYTKTQNTIQ